MKPADHGPGRSVSCETLGVNISLRVLHPVLLLKLKKVQMCIRKAHQLTPKVTKQCCLFSLSPFLNISYPIFVGGIQMAASNCPFHGDSSFKEK